MKEDYPKRNRLGQFVKITIPKRKELLGLYKNMTYSGIAEKYGCSRALVCMWFKKYAIKRKKYKVWNKGYKDYNSGWKHPQYKGGRNINHNGYIRVLNSGQGTYELEHRRIMEEALGQKLDPDDVVHHINGNKVDNSIDNLMVVSRKEHLKFHYKERDSGGRFI